MYIFFPEESVESSEASLWVSVISKPTHCVPFLFSLLTFTLLCIYTYWYSSDQTCTNEGGGIR